MEMLGLRSVKVSGLAVALLAGLTLGPGQVARASAAPVSTRALTAQTAEACKATALVTDRRCVKRGHRMCCKRRRHIGHRYVWVWRCHNIHGRPR